MSSVFLICLSSKKYCWFEVFSTTTVGTVNSLEAEKQRNQYPHKHTDNKHSDMCLYYIQVTIIQKERAVLIALPLCDYMKFQILHQF